MKLKVLKSLHNKATESDLKTINALYQNIDKSFLEVAGDLPSELNEEQIRTRYFRQPKEMRSKSIVSGTNFHYFFIIGGTIKMVPEKEAELKWVLGT